MNKTRISIITPTLNQGDTIEKCIDSVLSQNVEQLEYVIIDGGSTDDTVEIIKKYQKHLTYWISEKDNGQSDAINKGFKKTSGNIINWINSDDYYEQGALKHVTELFLNPKVNVVCGKSRLFNSKGTIKYSRGTDVYPNNVAKTIGWARIDQPETFFRREAWLKIGCLNPQLHYLMDKEWWIRYLLEYNLSGIHRTDKVLVNFRLHDESKTVKSHENFQVDHDSIFYQLAKKNNNLKISGLIEKMFRIHLDYNMNENVEIQNQLFDQVINYYLLNRAHELYYNGFKKECKLILKEIDRSKLMYEDQKLFRSIYLKNNFIPSVIINSFRRK